MLNGRIRINISHWRTSHPFSVSSTWTYPSKRMHNITPISPSLVPITSGPLAPQTQFLMTLSNYPSPHLKNLRSLKNYAGKATGLDNVSNEMMKLAGPLYLPFFTNLFNKVYSTACFPSLWKQAYITTLHKKGAKQDPANYHPLSITSCFGKLFT